MIEEIGKSLGQVIRKGTVILVIFSQRYYVIDRIGQLLDYVIRTGNGIIQSGIK